MAAMSSTGNLSGSFAKHAEQNQSFLASPPSACGTAFQSVALPLTRCRHTIDQGDPIAKLKALCQALQEAHGPGRQGPLSCRYAGKAIGTSDETAARLLKMLVAEKFLELVKPAGAKSSRLAAEYRLMLNRDHGFAVHESPREFDQAPNALA
jgi:hypothetical protein